MEISQVVLCKQLFGEAERYLVKGGPISQGLAVSMAQDAAELFLRAVIKDLHVPNQKIPDEFAKCMDYIDTAAEGKEEKKVPFRGKLLELNKARVNFKHYGLVPERADAARLVGYAGQFFEEATPRFFSLEFSRISLADMLTAADVRERIKVAEAAMANENFEEVMGSCAEAVEVAATSILNSLKPNAGLSTPFISRRMQDGLGRELADELADYIQRSVDTSSRGALMLALFLDVNEFSRFKAITPVVRRLAGGRFSRMGMQLVDWQNSRNAEFAIDFATRFAMAVDARMSSFSLSSSENSDPLASVSPMPGLRVTPASPANS
ncbi:hypothetical protein PQQ99_28150 [Paraburkholderia sediminicola]|uniref:hypothetical protein n=1 Tax=Paraburkholderia sediminicola TaxID=458836 RepID=UPI0038BD57A0